MDLFACYYLLTLLYCIVMQTRNWTKDVMTGGLGITPGLDVIALLIMCWALAPVDIFLKWKEVYQKAEEARRKHADTDNSLDGMK